MAETMAFQKRRDILALSVFSAQLMKYRKLRGFTQETLARLLNVTPQAVSKWEKGGYPDGELLPEIAKILDVSLDVLFGLQSEDAVHPTALLCKSLRELPDAEKPAFCMNVFYSLLSAYSNIKSHEYHIPERLLRETYAELKTNHEFALARLNQDMRYFCFVQIPQDGINSYAVINDRLLRFFRLLSRREALQIIYFFAGVERNHLWSAEKIADRLHLSMEITREVLDELDKMGAIWEVKVDAEGDTSSVYGYTYSLPLTTILVLATSFTNYLQYKDPLIEIWTEGAFRWEEP